MHAYWLLDQPFNFRTDDDRHEFKILQGEWESAVASLIATAGYEMDTGQRRVSRLLRLPLTLNCKHRKPVFATAGTGRRFSTDELRNCLAQAVPTTFLPSSPVITHNVRSKRLSSDKRDEKRERLEQAQADSTYQTAQAKVEQQHVGVKPKTAPYCGGTLHFNQESEAYTSHEDAESPDPAEFLRQFRPAKPGGRFLQIKDIVCQMKAIDSFRTISIESIRPAFADWLSAAGIRRQSGEFKERWQMFMRAWIDIRYGYARSTFKPLSYYFDQCKDLRGRELMQSVARLIAKDRSPDPFHLACREIAPYLGVSFKTASSILKEMVGKRELILVTPGKRGKASEYRHRDFPARSAPRLP